MATIIDGKELAKKIRANLKIECEELKQKNIKSKLAVIMVGEDPASKVYVRNKSRACEDVGIEYEEYLLDSKITQKELIELIEKLNNDKTVNGILLQSPIPSNLDINEAFRTISSEKDVDGFNPVNVGKLVLNQDTFVSCTPYGIMKMFEEYDIDLTGKNVVILGRSNIVGKPLIHCCLNKNATVTSCHSKTQNLAQKAKEADILISAIGKANFVTKYDCKIQEMLEKKLSEILPEAEFLGEEEDCQINRNAEYIFVVDPIDGTTNFIKDYHMSCVSIGLIRNGKRYMGVVHNPYLNETFYAISGEGAYMNGNAIHVSKDDLANSIVLFGSSPYNTELAKASFELAYEYFQKCLDIRRSGSAALDLCAIASGRAEIYFELILSPWDFAAGALIVEEAGGIVTTVEGEELPCLEKSSILARNK